MVISVDLITSKVRRKNILENVSLITHYSTEFYWNNWIGVCSSFRFVFFLFQPQLLMMLLVVIFVVNYFNQISVLTVISIHPFILCHLLLACYYISVVSIHFRWFFFLCGIANSRKPPALVQRVVGPIKEKALKFRSTEGGRTRILSAGEKRTVSLGLFHSLSFWRRSSPEFSYKRKTERKNDTEKRTRQTKEKAKS